MQPDWREFKDVIVKDHALDHAPMLALAVFQEVTTVSYVSTNREYLRNVPLPKSEVKDESSIKGMESYCTNHERT